VIFFELGGRSRAYSGGPPQRQHTSFQHRGRDRMNRTRIDKTTGNPYICSVTYL
jgi:hypothetical protein